MKLTKSKAFCFALASPADESGLVADAGTETADDVCKATARVGFARPLLTVVRYAADRN